MLLLLSPKYNDHNRDLRITGQSTSAETRDLRTTGQDFSDTMRDLRMTGRADSDTTRDLRQQGQNTTPQDYSTIVLTDKPRAYYKLDESSGTTATDSSGNSLNATIDNARPVTLGTAGAIVGEETRTSITFPDPLLANYCRNPSAETNVTAMAGWAGGETATVVQGTDAPSAVYGTRCFEITRTPTSINYTAFNAGSNALGGWNSYPVMPGETVYVHCWLKHAGGTAGSGHHLRVVARYLTSAGSYLSETEVQRVDNPTIGQWYQLSGTHVAPANAAYAHVIAYVGGHAVGSSQTIRGDGFCYGPNTIWSVLTGYGVSYVDGAQTDGRWSGTAHASTSYYTKNGKVTTPVVLNSPDSFSYECWFYPTQTAQSAAFTDGLVGQVNNPRLCWGNISSAGADRVHALVAYTDTGAASVTSAPQTLNQWHHAVFTVEYASSSAPKLTLYVDGALAQTTTAARAVIRPSSAHYINLRDSAQNFAGRVDEVAIYDYALSLDRAKAHYEAGLAGHSERAIRTSAHMEAGDPYSVRVKEDNPFSYFRLGEGSGTTINDSSANARTGTLRNAAHIDLGVPSLLNGDANTAMRFKKVAGQSGGDATLDGMSGLLAKPPFSVECWFKLDTTVQTRLASRSWVAGVDGGWLLYWNGATLQFGLNNAANQQFLTTKSGLVANTTYHVVGTYDGNTIRLYVDGTLASTNSGVVFSSLVATSPVVLASAASDGASIVLDEVSLYEYVLSEQVVREHYGAGTAPGPRDLRLTGRDTTLVERDLRLTAEDYASVEVGIYWDAIGKADRAQDLRITGELSTEATVGLCITGRGYGRQDWFDRTPLGTDGHLVSEGYGSGT